jgi:transcriptional regulator with XRE-family HTH domain
MIGASAPTFGEELRRYRRAAGLTQETLAERAGLSTRAISDLERGLKHRPRRDTCRLLVDALQLDSWERARLEALGQSVPRSRRDRTGALARRAAGLADEFAHPANELRRASSRARRRAGAPEGGAASDAGGPTGGRKDPARA